MISTYHINTYTEYSQKIKTKNNIKIIIKTFKKSLQYTTTLNLINAKPIFLKLNSKMFFDETGQ